MRKVLIVVLALVLVTLWSAAFVSAGDVVPGGNGGVPTPFTVGGDVVPGGNGTLPGFHVAGDVVPGGNG